MATLPTLLPTSYEGFTGTTPITTLVANLTSGDGVNILFGGNSTGSMFYGFADTPSDFAKMLTLTYDTRYQISPLAGDTETLNIAIVDSSRTINYVNTTLIKSTTTSLSPTSYSDNALTLTAAGLAASKAEWNNAQIQLSTTHAANMGADGSIWYVDLIALKGTYQTAPTVALNTPANAATGQTVTPTLAFTGTDTDGDAIEYNVVVYNTPDYYDGTANINFAGGTRNLFVCQSFTAGRSGTLTKIMLKLVDYGVYPTNLHARIWSHAGTYGTSSVGDLQLAQSDDFSYTDVKSAWVEFNFIGEPISLVSGTNYVFGVSGGADIAVSGRSSGSHSGNRSQYNDTNLTWITYATDDLFFYVVTDADDYISKLSSVPDAGFTAGHPFASGVQKDYTVQAGDTLANETLYFWKVRAIDPTGSNKFGAWSTPRSFTTEALVTTQEVVINTSSSTTGVLKGKTSLRSVVSNYRDTFELFTPNAGVGINSAQRLGIGQTFIANGSSVDSAKYRIDKTGSPDHDIVARIYSMSGDTVDSLLYTSDTLLASSVTGSPIVYTFKFGNNSLTDNVRYLISVEIINVTLSNASNLIYVSTNPSTSNFYITQGCALATTSIWPNVYNYTPTAHALYFNHVSGNLGQAPVITYISGTIDCSSTVTGLGTSSAHGIVTIDTATSTVGVLKAKGSLSVTATPTITTTGVIKGRGLVKSIVSNIYNTLDYSNTSGGVLITPAFNRIGIGTTFISKGYGINNVKFNLLKTGSPDHNIVSKIYSVSGTSISTAIATSDTISASSLGIEYSLHTFNFGGVSLVEGTEYFVSLEITDVTLSDASNTINCAKHLTSYNGSSSSQQDSGFTWLTLSTATAYSYVTEFNYTTAVIKGRLGASSTVNNSSDVTAFLIGKNRVFVIVANSSATTGVIRAKGKLIVVATPTITTAGLIKAKGRMTVAVTSSASTSVVGHLHRYALASVLTSTSTVAVIRAKGKISSAVNNTSTTIGLIRGRKKIFSIVNTSSSTIGVLKATGKILSTVTSLSDVVSNLSTGESVGYVTVIVDGVTTITGVIRAKGKVIVSVDNTTSTTAVIKGRTSLSSVINTASTTVGLIKGIAKLVSSSDGVSSTEGILTGVLGAIFGSSSGVTSTTGVLKGYGVLSTTADGVTSTTALIGAKGPMIGSAVSISSVVARMAAAPVPVVMNVTFPFTSNSESWVGTHINGGVIMGWSGGSIYAVLTGRNTNAGLGYWEWTGTFEDLGVPVGSTVSDIGYGTNNDYDWQCAQYTVGFDGANDVGPFELRDSVGTLIGTFSAEQAFITGTTAFATVDGSPIGSLNLASNTTIKLRINFTLRTGNDANATVEFKFDNVNLDVRYTPEAPVYSFIQGSADGLSTTVGVLTESVPSSDIAGTIDASSSTIGVIKAKGTLSATVNNSSDTIGVVEAKGSAVTVINNSTSTVGSIKGRGKMISVVTPVPSVTGSMKAKGKLVGSSDNSSTTLVFGHLHRYAIASVLTSTSTIGVLKGKGKPVVVINTSTSTLAIGHTHKYGAIAINTLSTTVGVLKAKGKSTVIVNNATSTVGLIRAKGRVSVATNNSSTTIGLIKAKGLLLATVNAGSTVNGSTEANTALVAVINTNSSTVGVLSAGADLAGIINTSSAVNASIGKRVRISGTVDCSSTVTGNAESVNSVSCDSFGSSNVIGTIKAKGRLVGVIDNSSTTQVFGHLHRYAIASILTDTSVTGVLTATGDVSGSADTSTATSADLNATGRLYGTVETSSSVTGTILSEGFSYCIVNTSSDTSGTLKGRASLKTQVGTQSDVIGVVSSKAVCQGLINSFTDIESTLTAKIALQASIMTHSEVMGLIGGDGFSMYINNQKIKRVYYQNEMINEIYLGTIQL